MRLVPYGASAGGNEAQSDCKLCAQPVQASNLEGRFERVGLLVRKTGWAEGFMFSGFPITEKMLKTHSLQALLLLAWTNVQWQTCLHKG